MCLKNLIYALRWSLIIVKSWAAHNRLAINLNKTKELVFRRPKVQYFHLPPAIDSIEQLDCCKLLGVFFQSNLKADSHVNYILSQCTVAKLLEPGDGMRGVCHECVTKLWRP